MNPKTTGELAKLPPDEFFPVVARGLSLVMENVETLVADADALCKADRYRAGRILKAFAEEEAAKILILLDAVRCPIETGPGRSNLLRQLKSFNGHIEKGIYIQHCDWWPASFEEAARYASAERSTMFINSSDYEAWIERNKILQDREDLIYVAYMKACDRMFWKSPADYPPDLAALDCSADVSTILRIVVAMKRCGFLTEKGTREIASIWRAVRMKKDFDIWEIKDLNEKTLQALEKTGVFSDPTKDDFGIIIDQWSFPLYDVDLRPIQKEMPDMEKLKKEHEGWIIEQLY